MVYYHLQCRKFFFTRVSRNQQFVVSCADMSGCRLQHSMPCPRATAYAVRLLSLAVLGTFGSALKHHSPPAPLLGLFCWMLYSSGCIKLFPFLSGQLAMTWLRGISCPSLACLCPIPLHHLLYHPEQLLCCRISVRQQGTPVGAGPSAHTPQELGEPVTSP